MKQLLTILALLVFSPVFTQVEVKEPIIMTGETEEDRQVKGLADPDALDEGVNARTIQMNRLNFAATSGSGNEIELSLSPAPESYNPGMVVSFIANQANTGHTTVDINGLGVLPLYKNVEESLDSAEIISGQIVSLVYDGENFQILSELNKPCPNGFIEINKDYCIEIQERGPASFWGAIMECTETGGKLCDWFEWTNACHREEVNITNMTDNWEWTDVAANNHSSAEPMNTYTSHRVGNGGCNEFGTQPIQTSNGLTTLHFHCCYSKRRR